MKKIIFTILLFLSYTLFQAVALDVKDIPNVQLQNSSRHLVNPAGIISPETQMRIDTLLSGVRGRTTSEVSVVVLQDLEGNDPDNFATELFEYWNIGKKDKDNGLLMLVSINDRAVVTRTGYGLEGVLPDIALRHIVIDSLYPRMRQGNYDLGVESTLQGICKVLDNPETLDEIQSSQKEGAANEEESFADLLGWLIKWILAITAVTTVCYIFLRIICRGKDRDYMYRKASDMTVGALAATFIGIGLPVIIYFLSKRWKEKIRQTPPKGSSGKPMEMIQPERAYSYLSPVQKTEARIKSMEFDVWADPEMNTVKVCPYRGPKYLEFSTCNKCGARAVQTSAPVITRHPTRLYNGEQVTNSVCLHCGNISQKRTILPKIAPVIIAGGRGGGGGGFSGGSFGGGHTGGGGFSGKW